MYTQSITSLSTWAEDSESKTTQKPQIQPLASVNSPGFLLGCAYNIFNFVPQAYDLVQRRRRRLPDSFAPGWLSEIDTMREEEQYENLHMQIASWEAPVDSSPDLAICGLIYREALLCYLEISFLLHPDATRGVIESTVLTRLLNFGVLLSTLPLDTQVSSTLLWPLTLFGVLTQEVEMRENIRQRLAAMWDLLGFGNISATAKFLELFWADTGHENSVAYSCGNGLSDVSQIMKAYNLDIALA